MFTPSGLARALACALYNATSVDLNRHVVTIRISESFGTRVLCSDLNISAEEETCLRNILNVPEFVKRLSKLVLIVRSVSQCTETNIFEYIDSKDTKTDLYIRISSVD